MTGGRYSGSGDEVIEAENGDGGTPDEDGDGERYAFGPFWIDFKTWQAKTRDGVVELSRKEVAVMKIFVEKPNEVVDRRELLERVWELPNHPNTRVVDNVIVALRKAALHPQRPRGGLPVRALISAPPPPSRPSPPPGWRGAACSASAARGRWRRG